MTTSRGPSVAPASIVMFVVSEVAEYDVRVHRDPGSVAHRRDAELPVREHARDGDVQRQAPLSRVGIDDVTAGVP